MDAQLKAKWIEALRSNEFEQARRMLVLGSEKDSKCLCCLGVLWHLCGRPEGALASLWNTHFPKGIGKLIDLNDRQERTFPQIADWIESHIPSSEPSA